jgi:hypothetical protein
MIFNFCFFVLFRINQDLRSWVQDNSERQQDSKSVIIPDQKSLAIASKPVVADSSVEPVHHKSRKLQRQIKFVFKKFLHRKI